MQGSNDRPMAGRTVVVTGGSGGIGKATALRLAPMGATVALTGRDRARTQDAADEIRTATGAQVHAFTADLSAQTQVRRLAADLYTLPRIDVLVNNAGGYWTPDTSPTTGSSALSPSTTSRHSCSPPFSWTG